MCGSSKEDVYDYCKTLINAKFYGETNSSERKKKEDKSLNPLMLNTGSYLQALDRFFAEFDDVSHITGDEQELIMYLKYLSEKRMRNDESQAECFDRLLKDKERFLQIYKARGNLSQTICKNVLFWGSRQQFRAGKVVADYIDPEYGPLDPIFGILLNPTGGIVGRGEFSILHKLFYDGSGRYAYHAAVHDSFGYLYAKHGVGPGYDYATPYGLCIFPHPISGQITGLLCWRAWLNRSSPYAPTTWF